VGELDEGREGQQEGDERLMPPTLNGGTSGEGPLGLLKSKK